VDDLELEWITEGIVLVEEVVRVITGILPEDELGRLILVMHEDEQGIIRDREVGVADLELGADVILDPAVLVTELETEGRFFTGVDGRVLDGQVLTGVEDRVGRGREDGTDSFDTVSVDVRLLGVVGLELTEEMLPLRSNDLLLLDTTVDLIEERDTELLRVGLVANVGSPFSDSEVESCNKHDMQYYSYV
jgi:hypothetical protein